MAARMRLRCSAAVAALLLTVALTASARAGSLWEAALAAPAEGGEEKPKADKPHKPLFEGEQGSLTLLNRVQFRWTQHLPDDKAFIAGTGGPGKGKGEFRIRRAKTELTGWLWRKELTYELQLSWAGPEPGASTQTPLEDFILSYDVRSDKSFRVSVGQFKVPLGRQEMTSSGKQQFCDRSILSFEFTRGRDIGIQLDGELLGGKLAYMTGIFNGNAASHLGNDNEKYQYNARVTWQPWGDVGYSEADFESKDKPLVAISAELEHNDQREASGTTDGLIDLKTTILGGDLVFKYKGFSAFAEYFARERETGAGDSFDSPGFHLQLGYFLRREKLEAAFRYARYDPSEAVAGNDVKEIGGALSYYIKKHYLKIQGDLRQLEDEARGVKNKELRVQTQVMF